MGSPAARNITYVDKQEMVDLEAHSLFCEVMRGRRSLMDPEISEPMRLRLVNFMEKEGYLESMPREYANYYREIQAFLQHDEAERELQANFEWIEQLRSQGVEGQDGIEDDEYEEFDEFSRDEEAESEEDYEHEGRDRDQDRRD